MSFLVVQFYAVDKGMNLLAFFKNLVIILFIILYLQFDTDTYKRLEKIPYSAVASALLCLILSFCKNSGIFVENRLQGIFYYANSYGLFLLIGVFIIINKEKFTWKEFVATIILFIGIILTNSRAIIVLTILALLISVFTNKKNRKTVLLFVLCFIVILTAIYLFSSMEKRVNVGMFESSEFITRLLYYKDSISLIRENPFGYGYEGWYYKQPEIQTAVYDAKYVHNSILQVALDVGLIPVIAIFIMLLNTFCSKKQNSISRIIMLFILGHSLIDIDLEYIYFILILVLFIDFEKIELKKNNFQFVLLFALSLFYFILFIGDAEFACGEYKKVLDVLPMHTEAIQEILYEVTLPNEQLIYAKEALRYNENVSGAYEAISNDMQSRGEYEEALKMEKKRLALNKYTMYNYIVYAQFLSDGIKYYANNGEYDKAQNLVEEVPEIEDTIENVLANTNPLCYKTIHSPRLEMPDELQDFIENAKSKL